MLKKIIFFAFVLLFLSPSAYAQQLGPVDVTKINPLPDYQTEGSEDEFLENSELYEEIPQGDRHLAYSVRLPKRWSKASKDRAYKGKIKAEEESLSQRFLGQVGKYYGPGRIQALSKFEIDAQGLEYDVTAKNWFMKEILARGYSLESLKIYSDSRIEALYVVVQGDTSFVVRTVAEINGQRMVVASYYVPDKFWEAEKLEQQMAIASFSFRSPERSRIEMTRSYSFLDLLTFDYPSSWRLIAPKIFSIQGMEADLIHTLDSVTLSGEIHISVISNELEDALSDEMAYLKEGIEDRQLEMGELIGVVEGYEFSDYIHYNHVESYKILDANDQILEHEYWMAILEEDRYYYVVTMLTPARDAEFYTWTRNVEAFQTVLESFRL